jgi:hypothetical protein
MTKRSHNHALAAAIVAALIPLAAGAAETCTFTKTLELGSTSEEVRCLQRYLNGAGYTVATSGVGSPGNETNLYREKTRDAVISWQKANGITPSTGVFGPVSQAKYRALTTAPVATPATPAATPATPATPTVSPATPATPSSALDTQKKNQAKLALKAAKDDYYDAVDSYEDAKDDDRDVNDAKSILYKALEKLLAGYEYFAEGNYPEAKSDAAKSSKLSDEAEDEIEDKEKDSKKTDKEKAKSQIKDAEDELDDARDEYDEAEDEDRDTNDADDLLDDAEDLIDDAVDAYEDEDWDEVDDLIDEALDLIDDALDEIED